MTTTVETMKLELKSVKVAKFASEETICFEAWLWINGKPVAHCKNAGHGGCTDIDFVHANMEAAFKAYCVALPMVKLYGDYYQPNGEYVVDELLGQYLQHQQNKRLCRTKTVYRLKGQKDGECWTINTKFNLSMAALLRAKHGDELDYILNERL